MMIMAHRGASKERPENTMAAFKRAAELFADGIETDVHLLCDGTLVVHHDGELGRCEHKTGGIYECNYNSIKSFSIGEKFSKEYKNEKILYFHELLDFMQTNKMFLNVEIKTDSGFITDIGDKVVTELDKYDMSDRCIISSFNHHVLEEIKQKHPQFKVGILYGCDYKYDVVEYAKMHKFDAIHPNHTTLNADLVKRCHDCNIKVNPWTVDSPEDLLKMAKIKTDSVISNDVATAKTILK